MAASPNAPPGVRARSTGCKPYSVNSSSLSFSTIASGCGTSFTVGASGTLQTSLEKRNVYFQFITRVLHEAGVNLVLGTDWGAIYAIPGSSTHDEIALLQKAGLPAEAILKMATINAARVLRVEDRLGSIAEGKTADLILVGHNPMTDPKYLRQPLAVVKNGQWLGKNELDMLKKAASNPSSTYFTMGRVLEFLIH